MSGILRLCGALLCAAILVMAGSSQAYAQDFLDSLFDSPAADQGPKITGSLDLLVYETMFLDIVKDDDSEDFLDNDLRGMLGATLRGKGWTARLSGSLTHTLFLDDQPGNTSLQTAIAPALWEAYVKIERDTFDIAAGNIITRWGRGAISLLDVLNPTDLRHGLSTPDEWMKIPVPQVSASYYADSWNIQAVYTPFYVESPLANTLSDWSPIRLSTTQDIADLAIFQQSVQQQIFPGIKAYPENDFLHGELGVRMQWNAPGWDFGLYGFTGYDRIPLPQFSEDFLLYVQTSNQTAEEIIGDLQAQEVLFFNPLYEQKPERNLMVAGDISTTMAGYTWRAELGFQPQYSVFDEDLNFLRPPLLMALLGVDSLASSTFVISLNFFAQWILVDPSLTLLQTAHVNAGVAGALRWDPEWAPLGLEMRGGALVTEGSLYLQPVVRIPVKDDHQIIAGVELVEGPDNRVAGGFNHNDTWLLRYRYQLGLDP